MADIVMTVSSISPGRQAGKIVVSVLAYEASENYQIGFEVELDFSATPNQVNSAVVATAIAEFGRAAPPRIVLPQDNKLLFCGALRV